MGNQAEQKDADGRLRDHLGNHVAAFQGGQDEPDKGEPGGSCNIRACQRPNAVYRNNNMGTPKYYCRECAFRLNRANTGTEYWKDLRLDYEVLGAKALQSA